MTGLEIITEERERQTKAEGFTIERDCNYVGGDLASAAICYAMTENQRTWGMVSVKKLTLWQVIWPWQANWWKPSPENRIRELAKAGALIAAEIDRLQHAAQQQKTTA